MSGAITRVATHARMYVHAQYVTLLGVATSNGSIEIIKKRREKCENEQMWRWMWKFDININIDSFLRELGYFDDIYQNYWQLFKMSKRKVEKYPRVEKRRFINILKGFIVSLVTRSNSFLNAEFVMTTVAVKIILYMRYFKTI